ncbi:N,N-dimethylformamidase beta subunit family domain-containing protein [Actinoplanes siamensis]|uniref:N,N-dimethylformamidase beta subunit family domain-containing protein n=1 Tax=Actinoplanes siamensis TaxID=1223317 RepID=UPI001EF2C369|nr:N,N-dimethylformamidase beta subunit family domain-containing protein [Actinoplanes siamensis]
MSPVVRENRRKGDTGWVASENVSDKLRQIQGYPSATSVNAGGSISFHVTVAVPQTFTVSLYRLGSYHGAGGRLAYTSPKLSGRPRPVPAPDPVTGLIDCGWPSSWTFKVPADWLSGLYLAVFKTRDGHRAVTPFVVRNDARRADFLMIVPVTTYNAYNVWPADGRTGKSLYKGYLPNGKMGGAPERAYQVSFNRPYYGGGRPTWFNLDVATAQFMEKSGYDVAYATSIDLHQGRIDPARYRALIFSGHDEYWSGAMRDVVEKAIRNNTHCAFLAANNIYWNIRVEADPRGVAGRVVTCYKSAPDPAPDETGDTDLWRNLGTGQSSAEARLMGTQYNGILRAPVPLVVRGAGHWMWEGTGVHDGDRIKDLVAVEADGWFAGLPTDYQAEQTLLSASPYPDSLGRGDRIQNTSICETPDGTIMFTAGTFHWPLALAKSAYTDARIQRATKNLFDRFIRTEPGAPRPAVR